MTQRTIINPMKLQIHKNLNKTRHSSIRSRFFILQKYNQSQRNFMPIKLIRINFTFIDAISFYFNIFFLPFACELNEMKKKNKGICIFISIITIAFISSALYRIIKGNLISFRLFWFSQRIANAKFLILCAVYLNFLLSIYCEFEKKRDYKLVHHIIILCKWVVFVC